MVAIYARPSQPTTLLSSWIIKPTPDHHNSEPINAEITTPLQYWSTAYCYTLHAGRWQQQPLYLPRIIYSMFHSISDINSPANWHIQGCINENYKLPCKQRQKCKQVCSELTLHVLLHAAHSPRPSPIITCGSNFTHNQSRDSSATVPVTDVHAFCSEHGYSKQLLEVTSWHGTHWYKINFFL